MNAKNRIDTRKLVLALIIAVAAVSMAATPVMAQSREIPGYVQMRLNNVVQDEAAKGAIIPLEGTDLNAIMALLVHKNHHVASSAAYALGEIRDAEAVPALIAALKSECNHMRRIAAHALGKIGDRRAVMPLIEVLRDGKQPHSVQASVIMSLGKIGDPGAKWILTNLNRSPRNWLQQTTNVALQMINAKQSFEVAVAR